MRIEQDGLEEGPSGAFGLGGFRPGFGFLQAEARVPRLEAGEAGLVEGSGEGVLLLLGEGELLAVPVGVAWVYQPGSPGLPRSG